MSTISAPAACIWIAVAMATEGSKLEPASEKLSGVVLTMPITSGRFPRVNCRVARCHVRGRCEAGGGVDPVVIGLPAHFHLRNNSLGHVLERNLHCGVD